jgi:hypothetical protein
MILMLMKCNAIKEAKHLRCYISHVAIVHHICPMLKYEQMMLRLM